MNGAAEEFMKVLNPLSFDALMKLEESLLKFQETTWADVHKHYESNVRIKDQQLSSLVVHNRDQNLERSRNNLDTDRRSSRCQF